MAKKLTSVESTWSQPVLHDIFEAGGLIKSPVRTLGTNRIKARGYEDHAKIICDEIKYRNFEFTKVDAVIKRLAVLVGFYGLHTAISSKPKMLSEVQIANILAAFCAEQSIFWDDVNTSRTTVEMETYRTASLLGSACWKFGCFLSQQADKKAPAAHSSTSSAASRSSSGAPKSDYKTSGPKSGLAKGLVGKPGEKTHLSKSTILYTIRCTSTKNKKQFVYVDPLRSVDVRLGDPSGYSDCKLFFASIPEAQKVIDAIQSGAAKIPDHISGFSFERQYADSNGYFIIDTSVGRAYIKASKLNEAIHEDVEEQPIAAKARKSRYPEIADVEVYSEAMYNRE